MMTELCKGAIDPFPEESWKALTLTTLILGLLQSWTRPREQSSLAQAATW